MSDPVSARRVNVRTPSTATRTSTFGLGKPSTLIASMPSAEI